MVPALGDIKCRERLGGLGSFPLERWKLWGDPIELCIIVGDMDGVRVGIFFPSRMEKSNTRGHNCKVRRAKFKEDVRGKFFLKH